MRVWKLGLLAAAAAMGSTAVEAKNVFGLPIAPGVPGKGPWIIALWPDEDCADCAQTDADRAAFAKLRDSILSGDYTGVDISTVRIHLLPERPFSPQEGAATTAELHALVDGCQVGSQGMLKQSRGSETGVSYGLGFDCPGVDHRQWMSVSFVEGRLTHIYYLPRDPIWVAAADD